MDRDNPLVSVVIPTFNRAHLISETLDSVLKQTYTNWECIVVDDGSTDSTEEILQTYTKKDSRFQYHKRPENTLKGGNTCRNIGFELSKGEFICWLDSDDLFIKEKLGYQVNQLLKTNSLVSITQSMKFKGTPKNVIKKWSDKIVTDNLTHDLITGKIAWNTAAPLWSRRILPKRPFHMKLLGAQEWYFHIKQSLLFTNNNFCFSEIPTVLVRESNESMSISYPQDLRNYNFLSARNQLFQDLIKDNNEYISAIIISSKRILKKIVRSGNSFSKNNTKALLEFSKLLYKYDKKRFLRLIVVLALAKFTSRGDRFWKSFK